jgi:hypothetical protein
MATNVAACTDRLRTAKRPSGGVRMRGTPTA